MLALIICAAGTWNVWYEITKLWSGGVTTVSYDLPIYVYAVEL